MSSISNFIKLNKYSNVIPPPRLVLMTRNYDKIGTISHYTNWHCSLRGNDLDEFSFDVIKYVNGVKNPIWDDLIDLKIIAVGKESDRDMFEIQVTYTDETKTTKSITAVSLENELGQVALYDFHVNDEFAMQQDDYDENNPTVLYIPNASEAEKKRSLLHRVLADKAPNWSIDDSQMTKHIKFTEDADVEQISAFQRSYTVDGTTIYDFLTQEVGPDANVVFQFDTSRRKLWCKSLTDTGYDGDVIGEDTKIFVSKNKLANEIVINSNKDEVKNCFRIEGGDDLITSQVAVINMTGTNYITYFADFQLNDMPEDLRNGINGYNAMMSSSEVQDEFYGEDGLYTRFVNANEELYRLKDKMSPAVQDDPPDTSELQWIALRTQAESTVIGVSSLNSYTGSAFTGVTNNIETMLNIWADVGYTVEVLKDPTPTYDATNNIWRGVARVSKYADTTDFYPPKFSNPDQYNSYKFAVQIGEDTDDNLIYTKQKVQIALAKGEMSRVDAQFNDETTPEQMRTYFRKWNLTKLQSFQVGYQTCLSVLMSGGKAQGTDAGDDPSSDGYPQRHIARQLYAVYKERLDIVNEVLDERQAQVNDQQEIVDEFAGHTDEQGNYIKGRIQVFQENLAFEVYLINQYGSTKGQQLYKLYCSYIREDTYQNSNKISDTLEDQSDLTKKAKELLQEAERELKRSCVLQRTMTINLNNLLAMPEFEELYEKFDLFNFIRVRTEDEILKLRLMEISYTGDTIESIEVTFSDQIESIDGSMSDLQSVLSQAKSIATSYSSTRSKANQGALARNYVQETIDYGLNTANTMLKNSDDNEVTITSAGVIAKRMDDEGLYGQKQLRIIGNGMYMTENAWDTVSMAVGEIMFKDPRYPSAEPVSKYGVIADAIVGNLIVGSNLYIENSGKSVKIDGDGITISKGIITWDSNTGVNPPEISDIDDLATTLEGLQDQVDSKIETYYQSTMPHTEYTNIADNTEYNKWIGDLWYDTTNDKSFVYRKENGTQTNKYNYVWEETDGVPDIVYDLIDGKSTIYAISSATEFPTNPEVGDLLIPKATFTKNSVQYVKNKVYRYNGTSFVEIDYTNDDALDAFKNNEYTTFKGKVQGALTGNATTEIGPDYVISPKIGGGYLYIKNANDNRSVTIDPYQTYSSGGYIFKVTNKTGTTTIGADSDGNATFTGGIVATSLNLSSNNVKVNASDTSGFHAVATSGSYNDLSNQPSIPKSLADLTDGVNVMHFADLSISTSGPDASGVSTETIVYKDNQGTSHTYTTKYDASGRYLLTNVGKGIGSWSSSTDIADHQNNYFLVSTEGLLKANNAIIYGDIYATNGYFSGELHASTGSIGSWMIDINDLHTIITSSDSSGTYTDSIYLSSSGLSAGYSFDSIGDEHSYNGCSLTKGGLVFIDSYEDDVISTSNSFSIVSVTGGATGTIGDLEFVSEGQTGGFVFKTKVGSNYNEHFRINSREQTESVNYSLLLSGSTKVTGSLYVGNIITSKSNVITDGNFILRASNNKSVRLSNNGTAFNYYIYSGTTLSTLRPFSFDLSTGKVKIANDLEVTGTISGSLTGSLTGNVIGNCSGSAGSAKGIDNVSVAGYHASAHYFQTSDWQSWATCYAESFVPQASSIKVKKNIENIDNEEASKLYQLRPVKFDFKNEIHGTNCYGLIAEEVEEAGINYPLKSVIMPDTKEEVLGLDYTRFIPYLIKTIQMQKNEIDELRKDLENMKK